MDLSTTYLGMTLDHPIVASASPLSSTADGMARLQDAGAAAIVMYSLFEEQIVHDTLSLQHHLEYGSESYAEATSYLPEPASFNTGPEEYLNLLAAGKRRVQIPVIGSLNGISSGGWTEYARLIQEAGADAIELNIYFIAADPDESGTEVEQRYIDVVASVRGAVTIPLAVKIGPYFSSTGHMARRLVAAGADALVLFNRFYQPDFDLENMEVLPSLVLSASHDMRLPLHWIAMLYGKVDCDFALTTGVHTHYDVLKGVVAGANVTQMASALLRHGVGRIEDLKERIVGWMVDNEVETLSKLRGGMSALRVQSAGAFERANYMRELQSYRPDPAAIR